VYLTMSTPRTDEDAWTRAKRGALWFDKVYPEWYVPIDPSAINLESKCDCIFGQGVPVDRYGVQVFNDGLAKNGFDLLLWSIGPAEQWLIDYGFLPDFSIPEDEDGLDDTALLNEAWTELVLDRQNG